jgi:hypothetical protein
MRLAAGELATLEGVDYLRIGMLDLARDLGNPGQCDHPRSVRRSPMPRAGSSAPVSRCAMDS